MTQKTAKELRKCYLEDLKHANPEQAKIILKCLEDLRKKGGKK